MDHEYSKQRDKVVIKTYKLMNQIRKKSIFEYYFVNMSFNVRIDLKKSVRRIYSNNMKPF